MSKEREFVDKDRPVCMKYYDICEYDDSIPEGRKFVTKKLKALIKKDPYFLDSYSHLYQILLAEGKAESAIELIENAYQNALKLILDKSGNWPDRLEWGWLENRHIIRAILNKGTDEWMLNNCESALDIFRKLFKANPNDNAGVRFYILAIRMGMSFEEYENKFNKGGYYDDSSWKWFEKNQKKFSEEFK